MTQIIRLRFLKITGKPPEQWGRKKKKRLSADIGGEDVEEREKEKKS